MVTASDTAYAIAFVRARESELPEGQRLFEDPYARIFAAAAGAAVRDGIDRFVSLPFFLDGIRLRTRHIDDVVRDAITGGARQLVLLGAGFDARALRLPEVVRHDVQTFEIDLPAQLETKRRLLADSGVAIPASVHHVAADFGHDFEARLTGELVARGFVGGRPTMFVWEGVTAYIDQAAIDRSLSFMASIGAAGSRLVFDFSDYVLDPDAAAARARRAGFTRFDEVRFDELWRRHMPGEPPPGAEVVKLAVASR
jgi:methyltransferase (TIGR00027 family)